MLVSISGDTANQTVGSSSGCFLGLLSFFGHPVALLTMPPTDLFVIYNHKYLLVYGLYLWYYSVVYPGKTLP